MDDGEFSDKLECIAKSLWGRGMKSINELNSVSIEEIFNKYGKDSLWKINGILTRNWDKWDQEMEDYFQKQKKSENKNGAITCVWGL